MSWSKDYKKSIDCDNPKGFSQRAHCAARKKRASGEETKSKSPFSEGTLHHWFRGSKSKDGKPGWVQADGSPCANEPGETSTPKCFSSGRLKALKGKGKKGEALIKSAVRRKRQKDKGQQAKSGADAPTNVPTFAKGKKDKNYVKAEPGIKEAMEINEASKDKPGKGSGTKDACYHKVKARYDVWPSAYASGALVKCRKVGADNWGTKTEESSLNYDWDTPIRERPDRYCPKCEKLELRSECRYGPKYWDMYSLPAEIITNKSDFRTTMPYAGPEINSSSPMLTTNQMKYNSTRPHPANEAKDYKDHEYSMARSELDTLMNAAKRLKKKMKGEGNIEAWVQSKITKAADYLDTAADYIDSGEQYSPKGEQIDEFLGGIPGDGYIGHPNLDIKNPLAKKQIKKKVLPQAAPGSGGVVNRLAAQLGDRALENYESEGEVIDEKCWKGYEKKGMKTMFGKRYPNCVKKEEFSDWRSELLEKNNPIDINKSPQKRAQEDAVRDMGKTLYDPNEGKKRGKEVLDRLLNPPSIGEDWQKVNRQDKTDGLSQKAVDAYRRENPGSKLQTAVTEKKPTGKRAKRRANFCRRMKGMKSKLTSAKTARDPDSRINKALRRWNCN